MDQKIAFNVISKQTRFKSLKYAEVCAIRLQQLALCPEKMIVTSQLPWWIYNFIYKDKDILNFCMCMYSHFIVGFLPTFSWLWMTHDPRTIDNFFYLYLTFFQFQWLTLSNLQHWNLIIICTWLIILIRIETFYIKQLIRCHDIDYMLRQSCLYLYFCLF